MESYIFKQWKRAQKEGTSLFMLLSVPMRVYTCVTMTASASSSILMLAHEVSTVVSPGVRNAVCEVLPCGQVIWVFFLLSMMLFVALVLVVRPIDKSTERSRLCEHYFNLKKMLDEEGVVDKDACEAICDSLQIEAEYGMHQLEFKRNYMFNMLLFTGGATVTYIVDSYISNGAEVLKDVAWVFCIMVFIIIVFVLCMCFFLFSKRVNEPYMKMRCAAELRIAFNIEKIDDGTGVESVLQQNPVPKHLKKQAN